MRATQNRFTIVAIGTFQVDTKAYFASTRSEAEKLKAQVEREHGIEFAIFRR